MYDLCLCLYVYMIYTQKDELEIPKPKQNKKIYDKWFTILDCLVDISDKSDQCCWIIVILGIKKKMMKNQNGWWKKKERLTFQNENSFDNFFMLEKEREIRLYVLFTYKELINDNLVS